MKFGRRPPLHNRRTMRAAIAFAFALDPLGSPPAASDDYVKAVDAATGGDWGMDGNDRVGDCVIADCAHQVMLHTANAGSIIVPTTAEVLAAYSAWTGYDPADPSTDQGADETTICGLMQSQGLCGQRSAGTGMVDPGRLDHLRWAVQLFGACRLGVTVTDAMVEQFNAGTAWETFSGAVLGGHDVPIVRYDVDYAYAVTWGTIHPIAWALLGNPNFLEEAHAEVYPDWIAATGTAPSGFDLQALLDRLPEVA